MHVNEAEAGRGESFTGNQSQKLDFRRHPRLSQLHQRGERTLPIAQMTDSELPGDEGVT